LSSPGTRFGQLSHGYSEDEKGTIRIQDVLDGARKVPDRYSLLDLLAEYEHDRRVLTAIADAFKPSVPATFTFKRYCYFRAAYF
jgi:hypothetical protein